MRVYSCAFHLYYTCNYGLQQRARALIYCVFITSNSKDNRSLIACNNCANLRVRLIKVMDAHEELFYCPLSRENSYLK